MRRIATLSLCAFALLMTANCACSSDDSGGSSSGKLAKFGESLSADNWEVTVVESKTQSEVKDSIFEHKAADGAILHLVKLKLKNTSKEKQSPLFAQHKLIDGDTKFDPSGDCSLGLKEKFGLADINPGLAKTGWVCFEVPKDAKPTKFTFKGDPIMGDELGFAYSAKPATKADAKGAKADAKGAKADAKGAKAEVKVPDAKKGE